jgi:hypothetical protein
MSICKANSRIVHIRLLSFTPNQYYNFSRNWLYDVAKKDKERCVLYYGHMWYLHYDSVLTIRYLICSCGLYIWLLTGFVYGPILSRWNSAIHEFWVNRLQMIYTTSPTDILKHLVLFLFLVAYSCIKSN